MQHTIHVIEFLKSNFGVHEKDLMWCGFTRKEWSCLTGATRCHSVFSHSQRESKCGQFPICNFAISYFIYFIFHTFPIHTSRFPIYMATHFLNKHINSPLIVIQLIIMIINKPFTLYWNWEKITAHSTVSFLPFLWLLSNQHLLVWVPHKSESFTPFCHTFDHIVSHWM